MIVSAPDNDDVRLSTDQVGTVSDSCKTTSAEVKGKAVKPTNSRLQLVASGYPYLDTGTLKISNSFRYPILKTIFDSCGTQ